MVFIDVIRSACTLSLTYIPLLLFSCRGDQQRGTAVELLCAFQNSGSVSKATRKEEKAGSRDSSVPHVSVNDWCLTGLHTHEGVVGNRNSKFTFVFKFSKID